MYKIDIDTVPTVSTRRKNFESKTLNLKSMVPQYFDNGRFVGPVTQIKVSLKAPGHIKLI